MVTIIITAYNKENTLAKAIQSCLSQSYSDLELLIINDCSTDNTLEVIKSFKDSRIRIINNEVNLGAGMSRRIGTQEAKGDYTTFLDGDDYLEADYIETLYNIAKKYNADVVSSGLNIIESNSVVKLSYKESERVVTREELIEDINDGKHLINIYLNTKLVAKSIWDKAEYSNRRYVEDTQSCYYVLFFAKTIVTTSYIGYNYIQDPQSLCHTAGITKHKIYQALCAKDICEFVAKYEPERTEEALQAFAIRVSEIGKLELPDSIRDTYKDELSELFTFFLQNITF